VSENGNEEPWKLFGEERVKTTTRKSDSFPPSGVTSSYDYDASWMSLLDDLPTEIDCTCLEMYSIIRPTSDSSTEKLWMTEQKNDDGFEAATLHLAN